MCREEGAECEDLLARRVSEKDSRSEHTHKPGAADSSHVARMTSFSRVGTVNELTHEMGRSFNATTGAGRVPLSRRTTLSSPAGAE